MGMNGSLVGTTDPFDLSDVFDLTDFQFTEGHCMYVCICVCMYVCVYICVYVCMYVCTYVCMYVCISVCVCVCVWFMSYLKERSQRVSIRRVLSDI